MEGCDMTAPAPRVRDIRAGEMLLAQVFDFDVAGPVIFPTPESAEMQCGFGQVDTDKAIKPHVHNIVERQTFNTSEFIFVIAGEMLIVFLDPAGAFVARASIGPGQGFLQYVGGHEITILAGTRYFELKQGPYLGHVKDKTLLEGGTAS
jgi:hypothetical protein